MTDDTYFNIDFFVAPEVLMKVRNNGKSFITGNESWAKQLYRDRHQ